MAQEILFPVGRMIGGSMYKPQPKTDRKTKLPVMARDGVTPVVSYSFGLAIPKQGEQHWSQTQWGAMIKQVGDTANPGISQRPDYAWKIIDGDSTIPNTKNKRPADQEGYKGNWVIWFSQGWAPKLVNANGTIDLTEPDSVMPGYFLEVLGSVAPNNSVDSPGVYLNPVCVALAGYGERIESSGINAAAVGFGAGRPVAGMSQTPVAGMVAAPGVSHAVGVSHTVGVSHAPNPPAGAVGQPAPMNGPGAPVNTAFLAPPPPPKPAHVMTAAATGTYDQYVAAGWSDAQMVQNGVLQA